MRPGRDDSVLCTLATGWLGRRACGAESIPRTYGAARLEGARGAVSIVRACSGKRARKKDPKSHLWVFERLQIPP